MLEKLLQYDTQLFLFLNRLGNENWDGFWLFTTEKYASIPLYLALLYLIWKHFSWKATLLILVTVAIMITATDQLANLFKYVLFQRPRPCRVEALQDHMRLVAKVCGRYGYFSAHAASSMATAVFVGLLLKKHYRYLPFLLLFWAAMIAYSRIYLGVHYPLDIITGMVAGGILGWLFFTLWKVLQKRFIAS
ncbi:MAG: phosphatase PAP2 family protein [Flavobacteriaceae bacterium]|nr:phosphatase PAP2 family protein [Flavobacteriaceae bacterium]